MTAHIQKILSQLDRVRQIGDKHQWQARCPAHEDTHPSLSVGLGKKGQVLLKCHAGCALKDILAAMKLTKKDMYENTAAAGVTVTAAYDYRDAEGTLLYQVLRKSDKTFSQRRPAGNNSWVYSVKDVPKILYRLPELLAADPTAWVFVVEGEKDVDSLTAIGVIATTNSGGAGNWKHLYDDSALYGRRVVVIPDKDATGYKHADEVCRRLADKAETLRYLPLPGTGKDATDWVNGGGNKEQLLHLAETAPAWRPHVHNQDSWPPLQPLERPLPDVEPFDLSLLPSSFREWITDIAERMQCPVDFPAVTAMVALGGVVGRKIGLRPKRYDDWTVVPNLWGALIGRPSIMKTPPLKAVLKPLETLMDAVAQDYDKQMKDYTEQKDLSRLEKAVLEGKIKSAMRAGRDIEPLRFEMAALNALTPPVHRRYAVNDCTVQALGQILSDNPHGVIVIRDELIGLLKFLESQGQETSRAFYLEGWDGNGRYETDRIGRGHIHINAICLSVIGTIQPGPLQEYLYAAVEGGTGDDGLMQRFQLAVWPDDPKEWVNIDRYPNQEARILAKEVFLCADLLKPDLMGAQHDVHDEQAVPFLHFTPDAQDCFDRWMVTRENHLRQGHENAAMESHLTKYRSLIPSLALLIHLAEFKHGDVELNALQRAIGWGDYLSTHARRIYGSTQEITQQPVHLLAGKIRQGHINEGFTARDIHKCHWSGLNDMQIIEDALEILSERGWLRPERKSGVGRPTIIYHLHPDLQKSEKSSPN